MVAEQLSMMDFGGEGPILHFAHPNAYGPELFAEFLRPFTQHYHVIAQQQRPLWPHQSPDDLTDWRVLADDLIYFLDQQGVQQVVGMGHSLGAVLTMVASAKRPDLFSKLVLLDPVFMPPHILQMVAQLPEQAESLPLVSNTRKRRDRWPTQQEAFAHYRAKSVFARFSDETLWAYINTGVVPADEGGYKLRYSREWEAAMYKQMMTFGHWVWDYLPQVTQPTLGVRAAETDALFPEGWQLWQAVQPGHTFVEMPDVSHLLMLEKPTAVAELVLAYLQAA